VIAFGSLFATLAAGWSPKLGLDLAGGTSLVLVPAHKVSNAELDQTVAILSNRVDGLGVSGATVQTQGNQIVVSVPGVNNGRALAAELVTTAQLYFRPVMCFANAYAVPPAKKAPANPLNLPACATSYQLTAANINVQQAPNTVQGYTSNNIPPDPQYDYYPSTKPLNDNQHADVLLPGAPGSGSERYFLGAAELTGTAVHSAVAQQDQTGQWVVNCTLTASGAAAWDSLTKSLFHQYLGIDLDGVVVSAPIIQPTQTSWTSFQGQVQISGSLTQASANTLAIALNYGSLPVPLTILTSETVSPTLGHSALVAGLAAGLAGLFLVLLYVILYYRLLGLVVVLGLAVTAAFLWALISALGQTSVAPSFDLAGITGLIVSIGITVDSYIVYFERLKDETRSGRTVRTSLDRGFASAWRTVVAADTVSLLAAVLLYFIAVGDVKGFAFFLGLSTILDLFVTWFFTRPTVVLLGRNESLTSMRGFGIAKGLAVGAPA
jgi:preprotein translocase subunit SecD